MQPFLQFSDYFRRPRSLGHFVVMLLVLVVVAELLFKIVHAI